MKTFSELGVESTAKLTGLKIRMKDILNRQVTVKAFSIDQSKFPNEGNGKRLTIQIMVGGEERVLFTSSLVLQEQITKVNPSDFPFMATIVALEPRGYKMT